MIFFALFAVLSNFSGQLGPNYDPLFYDVIIYLVAGIIFLIIIIAIIVKILLIIRKKRKNKAYLNSNENFQDPPKDNFLDKSDNDFSDDSNEKKWDGI